MAKTVDRPMYDTFEDTPYITHNREMEGNAYDRLNNAINNLNRFNEDQYQAVADAYTQAQWNDLNRGYQQAINQNAARERQRLGTSGASSSLYNTNTLQNTYNDMASRVAANTASQYQNLINNEYNRRLQNLNTFNNLWTNSGNRVYQHDYNNWQIENINKDRKWLNDVDAKNNNWWNTVTDMIGGSLSGASQGFQMGGPWGAVAGGIAGALGESGTGYTPAGGTSSGTTQLNANNISNMSNILGSLLNRSNANNYQTYASNQDWLANNTQSYGLNTNNYMDKLNSGQMKAFWNR